jgi:hypothetical protein
MNQLPVLISGVLWLTSACVLVEVARLLGPTFHTKRTAHPFWRFLTWAAAVVFFVRGMTLLFPGQLVEISRVSIVAPFSSTAVLGVTLALLDWVMRDRAPPPWSVQMVRLAALLGKDGPVKFAAMQVPPAAVGDALPPETLADRHRSRLPVLIGAILIVAALALFLAISSPASAFG